MEKGGKDWSKKLDRALWAYQTAHKTPIGMTPYRFGYGKSYYLPLELAHCVDHLQDENNKLCEVLSWLSSQEPELGMMIASYKRFDGGLWGRISLVRALVRENH
jgi:hypothetical protein